MKFTLKKRFTQKFQMITKDNQIGAFSSYLFKVNNGNTRNIFEICSKLAAKTLEGDHFLLILNRFHKSFWCFHC